jgi:hypothetical protein
VALDLTFALKTFSKHRSEGQICHDSLLAQKAAPLALGFIKTGDSPAREDEMSAAGEEKIKPVAPERLHRALGIYQTALVADAPDENADEAGSPDGLATARGILAVKREFPDPQEFLSLSLRLQRFAEIVSDKKLIKWGMVKHSEGGLEIHDAVVNALAAAPFRKSGVLDKEVFHELVKAEFNRLEAAEKK